MHLDLSSPAVTLGAVKSIFRVIVMAGRKEGTRDAVHRVANEILREGKLPTGREVHARIGTGSFQTIYSELEQWARATADRNALPDLPVSVREGFVMLWESAVQAASHMTQPQLDMMAKQLEEKDHQIALLRTQLDELNEIHLEEQHQLEQTASEMDALQTRVAELTGSQARYLEQIGGLQHQVTVERQKADDAQAFFQQESRKSEAQYRALEDKTLQELDQARQAMRLKVEALETAVRREQAAIARQKEAFDGQLKDLASRLEQSELLCQKAQDVNSGLREALGISRARELQLETENTFLKEQQVVLTTMIDKIKTPALTGRSRSKKA